VYCPETNCEVYCNVTQRGPTQCVNKDYKTITILQENINLGPGGSPGHWL